MIQQVVCLCSVVQCIPELLGPCSHVHLLFGSQHCGQGCQEEEEVPVVGPLRHAIPDAAVCEHDDPSRVHTVHQIALPKISVKFAVLLHDHALGIVCKLLPQKAWGKEEELP